MFWRVVARSLGHRPGRLALGALAVALAAALVASLVQLSSSVEAQAGRELRAYGANIVVRSAGDDGTLPLSSPGSAEGGAAIDPASLRALGAIPEVVSYAPFLYLIAEIGAHPVVVAGTDFAAARSLSPWWEVDGQWPERSGQGLLGVDAARALAAHQGDDLVLAYGDRKWRTAIAGVVETGGSEDGQVLLSLPDAQRLGGREGEIDIVQVSALARERSPEDVAATIQRRLPDVEATPLNQFTRAEARVLDRVRRLIGLVALLVLVVAGLTVASTLATRVLERRQEVGLLKALGATHGRVARLFLAEAVAIGLAGGSVGYLAGVGLAGFIGRRVFDAVFTPAPAAFPITLTVAVGAAVLASVWPVRRALEVDAAVALRGE